MFLMDIDIVLHNSKEMTVQCAQIEEHNIWVRECWFWRQCERKYSVENQTFRRAKSFVGIL